MLYGPVGKEEEEALQEDLNNLWNWAIMNGMSFNVSKCQIVRFSKKRKVKEPVYIMGGTKLESKNSYKYLGVLLNRQLDWGDHVENLVSKVKRNLNYVMRNLYGASEKVKEKAYVALIRPIVEYAGAVWDPYKDKHVRKIESLQRWAARKVKNKLNRRKWVIKERSKRASGINITLKLVPESVSDMIGTLGWESLEKRRRRMRLMNFYRVYNAQEAWRELGTRMLKPGFLARGDHNEKVMERMAVTDVGRYSFVNRTIGEWNKLDGRILKEMPKSVKEFRNRIFKT